MLGVYTQAAVEMPCCRAIRVPPLGRVNKKLCQNKGGVEIVEQKHTPP